MEYGVYEPTLLKEGDQESAVPYIPYTLELILQNVGKLQLLLRIDNMNYYEYLVLWHPKPFPLIIIRANST